MPPGRASTARQARLDPSRTAEGLVVLNALSGNARRRLLRTIVAAVAVLISAAASAQTPAPRAARLWPNGAPGSAAHRGEPERAKDWWAENIHGRTVSAFPAELSHKTSSASAI